MGLLLTYSDHSRSNNTVLKETACSFRTDKRDMLFRHGGAGAFLRHPEKDPGGVRRHRILQGQTAG